MKYTSYYHFFATGLLSVGLFLAAACSQEETNEVAALNKKAQVETQERTPSRAEATEGEKRENLLMMFTGQYCSYCTSLKDYWDKIYTPWGDRDKLHVVSLHGLSHFSPAFFNETSKFYFDTYGRELQFRGIPKMLVNLSEEWFRSRGLPQHVIDRPEIATSEVTAVKQAPTQDEAATQAKITYTAQAFADKQELVGRTDLKVIFWLIEKKARGFQTRSGYNYEHHNLLRRALFPVEKEEQSEADRYWGEPYTLGTTLSFECRLEKLKGDNYHYPNLENCYVMAILTDAARKDIYEIAVADLSEDNVTTGIVLPRIGKK